MATPRVAAPPAPGPLEEFAAQFDALFGSLGQRRSFREYLSGLLLPRERNKTLTALAGAEPIVQAQEGPVQRLQFFLSEAPWEADAVNQRRLELLLAHPQTAPHDSGALIVDETGDRKEGNRTDHVARQYLGSVGKVDNGIVAVSTLWADERLYYPLHVQPYTPAERLPRGKKDPAFRTKPQIAMELVDRALSMGLAFRAVVGDCVYGESVHLEGALWEAGLPYVLALRPSRGTWAPEDAAHTPEEAARELRWRGPDDPGDWTAVTRRFRDGHTERWWAAELSLGGSGGSNLTRLIVATNDPAALPRESTWYLVTNLPAPGAPQAGRWPVPAADLEEIVRLYGLRNWVEQGYKQAKGQLGWADFQVRKDRAIRRHWELVCCAFCFCWWARFRPAANRAETRGARAAPKGHPLPGGGPAGKRGIGATPPARARRTPARQQLAGNAARRQGVVNPVEYAVALLARVEQCAPAGRAARAARLPRSRPPDQPISPCLTNYH